MLWDILDLNRQQWDDALHGNYETKTRPLFKTPALKYYMTDYPTHKIPMMRFTILGEPAMDKDYGYPLRPVLAIAELKQFDVERDPHGWSMPYISVDPSLHKKGVARELFRHAIQWLKANDPDVVLHRTANSDSGKHWQHVADTELFAAKIPWTQAERGTSFSSQDKVHMKDFDSPTARMIDALQRKSTLTVQTLLREHPGHDWNVPNDAFVHPLGAALNHLPAAAPNLIQAGAHPGVYAGWLGHKVMEDSDAFQRWLNCFDEQDHGHAYALAVAGHRRFAKPCPVWDQLSPANKATVQEVANACGTYSLRGVLGTQPSDAPAWTLQEWDTFARTLNVAPAPALSPQM